MLDLSELDLHNVVEFDRDNKVYIDRLLFVFKKNEKVYLYCSIFDLNKVCGDFMVVATSISTKDFDKEHEKDVLLIETVDGVYECTKDNDFEIFSAIFLPYELDTVDDYWNRWESIFLKLKAYSDEETATKILQSEARKWGDFLWLGRHLYLLVYSRYFDKEKDKMTETEAEIQEKVLQSGEEIIKKYTSDHDYDFLRCFDATVSKNGDKEWEHICNNVGTLREFLWGEWNLDS